MSFAFRRLARSARDEYGSIQSGQKQKNDELPTHNHCNSLSPISNEDGGQSLFLNWIRLEVAFPVRFYLAPDGGGRVTLARHYVVDDIMPSMAY